MIFLKFFYIFGASKINFLKQKDSQKIILNNFLSLGFLRFSQEIIPLIALPYILKTIGIKNYGLIGFALSSTIYFGSVVEYGFLFTATRDISRIREYPEKLSEVFSKYFFTSLFLGVVVFLFYSLLIILIPKFNQFLFLYISTILFTIFKFLLPTWFFQGIEKIYYNTLIVVLMNIGYLVCVFSFINNQNDYYFLPFFNFISALLAFIFSVLIVKYRFRIIFKLPSFEVLKNNLVQSRHIFIKQISQNLYNNPTNIFILGLFFNSTLVGLYILASKVVGIGIAFNYLLSQAFLPSLSRNIAKHINYQKVMLIFGFCLNIILLISADIISDYLVIDPSLNASFYIRLLSFSIFFVSIINTYGDNYLNLIGKEKIFKNISFTYSLIFFLISLLLIPSFGLAGAVTVPLLARLMIAITSYNYFRKYKIKE
ncbi:MAG: oligosaccharide flippase family protein [Prochlorococcus marinus XMU1428]|nr:oligosaccharide flippase family protein [Prochlorococcus marinus XMU1428]